MDMITFKFYNITADTWHMFEVLGDNQPKYEISYDDPSLLMKISEVLNHHNSFAIVPMMGDGPNFTLSLELDGYSSDDIELIINYMRNLSN